MATGENVGPRRFGNTVREGVVAIEIGPDRAKHFVHKALLEEHSDYFRKALNGSWKEAEDKVVSLDDVEYSTFEVFVEWLYTRKLPVNNSEWVEEEYQKPQHVRWHTAVQIAMIKAYAFADRMLSPDLLHALKLILIDYFIVAKRAPFYGAIIYAFANLPATSPILKAMIDAHCRDFDDPGDTEENGELNLRAHLPHAFLVGVMVRYANIQPKKKVRLLRCDYHEHATEGERRQCQRAAQVFASEMRRADKARKARRATHRNSDVYGSDAVVSVSESSSSDESESESSSSSGSSKTQ